MRVALTLPQAGDLGGVERQAHGLAVALCDAGHEVHFFCERSDPGVDPRIHLHRLRRWVRPVKSLKVWLFDARVRRAIAREGPFDIVQGFGKTSRQDVYCDGSGCLSDFQRYSIDVRRPWATRWLHRAGPHAAVVGAIERARYTAGHYRRIVAVSELVRGQILRRHGVPPDDVEVVYPGVDLERFRPAADGGAAARAELGLGGDVPLLVFLGSDYARKGLEALLAALGDLPGVRALVIGRDRHEARYRRRAEVLGVAERVHWLGLRPDPERWLAAGDCLVFPSHFDAFGVAVLEALACGVPAVVSRRAGAAELIVSGRTGALVDGPEPAGALAEAVRPLLDRARRAEVARAARAEAERYGWEHHRARLLEIYAELAGSGGG